MFRNIKHHIIQIISFSLIITLFFFIVEKNLFSPSEITKKIIVYSGILSLFAIFYYEFHRQTKEKKFIPMVIIPAVIALTFICSRTIYVYDIFGNNIGLHRIVFSICYLYIFTLFLKTFSSVDGITVLGVLLVIDTFITILVYFPYGYPTFDFKLADYRLQLPIQYLSSYRVPTLEFTGVFDFFLNIRRLLSLIFAISVLYISFDRFRQEKIKEKVLQGEMKQTNFTKYAISNFIPYVSSLILAISNSILSFFKILLKTAFEQIRGTVNLLFTLVSIYILFSFPLIFDSLSKKIISTLHFNYIREELNFQYFVFVLIFFMFIFLTYLTALFLNVTETNEWSDKKDAIKTLKEKYFMIFVGYDKNYTKKIFNENKSKTLNEYILIPKLQKSNYERMLFLFSKLILTVCMSSLFIFILTKQLGLFTILFFIIIALAIGKLIFRKKDITEI